MSSMLESVNRGLLLVAVVSMSLGLVAELAFGDTVTYRPLAELSASSSASAAPTATALTPERVRQSLVTVEVGGVVRGVGVVLDGDGRIVTNLSAVTNDLADVRYSDGHTAHARVGHKDPVLDLALLVPLSGRYLTGLQASDLDPLVVELRTVTLAAGRPTLGPTKIKGRVDAHAKDGTVLSGATEIDHASASGAPLLDPNGRVMGVSAHACRNTDAAACSDVTVIVPILSIKIFLSHTPVNAVPPSPWLGINGTSDTVNGIRGVRVQAVAPHSPAERAGLKTTTDLIVVADSQPLDTPERLAEIVSKHAVGETLKLSVFAAGHYREVNVALQPAP